MRRVDPRFPARLRELRTQRGWSLRELSARAYVGRSTLSEIENGVSRPSMEMARHLDRTLRAGGELASLITIDDRSDEDSARIAYVMTQPARLDKLAVDALARVLAAQRRLDDTMPPHALLPAVEPQWAIVQQLAHAARGPYVTPLRRLTAEWTQFVGWLHAQARHDAKAVQALVQAGQEADEVGDGVLAAQAENFRGYLERQRNNPRGIVRHFLAAYHTPGADVLQRIGDGVQAAHGVALLGDRDGALRLLGEASDLTESVEDRPAPEAAYWLSPTFHRLSIGLAHLGLDNRTEAVDNLRAGLDGLPQEFAAAGWTGEYRNALNEAVR